MVKRIIRYDDIKDEFTTYVIVELGLSQETLRSYTYDVKEFLRFADQRPLTAKLVEEFVSTLKLKSTTIHRKVMAIRVRIG